MKSSRVRLGRLAALLSFSCGVASAVHAASYPLPPSGEAVVGQLQHVKAWDDDTLLDIARRHGLGFEEIKLANPHVDPWLPGPGTPVLLPTRYVLPNAPRKGIVLNLAEMRLYYYPTAKSGERAQVITYPVSIGRGDWETPLGLTHIATKVANPAWYPPASIREEHEKDGDPLPEKVPPGPDNPLGEFALRLALPGYLIHGTNKPYGIGMKVSHGCVRLYPEDISLLFERVPKGAPVRIVNQPYKTGWYQGALMLEAHPPKAEKTETASLDLTPLTRALVSATEARPHYRMDWKLAEDVAIATRGIPLAVAFAPATNKPTNAGKSVRPLVSRGRGGTDKISPAKVKYPALRKRSVPKSYRPPGISLKITGGLAKSAVLFDPAWPEGWTLPGRAEGTSRQGTHVRGSRQPARQSGGSEFDRRNGALRIARAIHQREKTAGTRPVSGGGRQPRNQQDIKSTHGQAAERVRMRARRARMRTQMQEPRPSPSEN